MPIFEYECESCGSRFEELLLRRDAPEPACDSCGSDDVRRVMSNTNFVLKGTGWYSTDYPGTSTRKVTDKPKKSSDDDGGDSGSSSSSGSSSGETGAAGGGDNAKASARSAA